MKFRIAIIPLLICSSLLSAEYVVTLDNKHYKNSIVEKPIENSGNNPSPEPEEIIIQNNSYYDGTNGSAASWTNISNSCNVSNSNTNVTVSKASGSNCQTNMVFNDPLTIQPNENFDISLTITKNNYSNNYSTHIMIPDFFSWYYNIGISSVYTTVNAGYQNGAWDVSIPNDYNNSATFRLHLENGIFTFYKNGSIVQQSSNFNFAGLSNAQLQAFTNNASVSISNISIKVYQ